MEPTKWDAALYVRNAGYVSKLGTPLIEILARHDIRTVLDLGCGEGELTALIAERGYEVVGIDSSPDMVAAARERGVRAYVMDGQGIALEQSFDAVVSNAALHWMREPDAVLRGVRGVLVAGGLFVGEFGGQGNIAAVVESIEASLRRLGRQGLFRNPWYFPACEEYRRKLEGHGFTLISIESYSRPTPLSEGLAGWLRVFARETVDSLPEEERGEFLRYCEEHARDALWSRETGWIADYVRLRFEARLP